MIAPTSADRLRYSFPPELPISAQADAIRELWAVHPVIIVGGATGSGKTTQLPKIALAAGGGRSGRIGCTQPRRLAATAMARRVAAEFGVECGAEVGYQVRFDDRTGAETVIKFMTDGILLAETRRDRLLRQYDTLIIDEAHERSLNIDFLLGYLKNLRSERPDLRLAISSATLDLEQFSRFFDGAPIVEIEGRTYPIEDCFMPPLDADEELTDQVARAVEFLTELDRRGDILVFLPGEREIREAADLLTGRNYAGTEVLPLYARLSSADQQKVFRTGSRRRIVLATNVAETSVTIPGIRFCIDSGLARISRYNPRTRIQELQVETISQASARQRRGRCGRTADGVCVHLCSEDDLARSAPYTDPEIRRTSLAGVILQMAALHLPRIDRFPFLDPPPAPLIREGLLALEDIRAIQPGGRMTSDGWKLAELPVDPHLGKMLLEAQRRKVLAELLVIVAALSLPDPRERPTEKQQAADEAHRQWRHEKSDFLAIVNLWNALHQQEPGGRPSHGALRRFCRKNYLNYNRINEWCNLVEDLTDSCREQRWTLPPAASAILPEPAYDAVHEAILAGIPRQIARYVPEYQYYLGTGGRKFTLFPGSGLFKRKPAPAWIMTFALVETTRLYARQNAEIRPDYLERVAPHLCNAVCEAPYWDPAAGFVYAREKLTSGGLVLHPGRRIHYAAKHPAEARTIYLREALTPGAVAIAGTWTEAHADRLTELAVLEEKLRRPDTVIDPEAIFRHFDAVLPSEVVSTAALKKLLERDRTDYAPKREAMMQEQYHSFDEADYPDELRFSGHAFRLRYQFHPGGEDDGVTLVVPDGELNLLPAWALDYLIPGYLGEKIELMLRALPKAVRQQLSPLAGRAAEFMEEYRTGGIFTDQPLADALADFLAGDAPVTPRDFEAVRLPEFLTMKLAELNAKGEIRRLHREMPDRRNTDSRLSTSVDGVAAFARTGCRDWPGGDLPGEMPLPGASGKIAFPALVDEGQSVGCQLFLRPAEARARHRAGLIRLFQLRHADQVRFIRRTFRLPREMLLSWFAADREQRYLDDLVGASILAALDAAPETIRSAADFQAAEERAAQELGGIADRRMAMLGDLFAGYERTHELHNRLKSVHGVDSRDARQALAFLFAVGFLNRPAVWTDYARYLRAARLRAERLNSNPAKDREKLEPLLPWIEKFQLAAAEVGEISEAPELYDFWRLLEECRICRFAPEIPLRERAPVNRLETAWKQLRF